MMDSRPNAIVSFSSFLFRICAIVLPLSASAQTVDVARPHVQSFISRVSEQHGFNSAALQSLLGQAEKKDSILQAMARPAEKTLTWQEYRARFITSQRIEQGVEFWLQHRELLDRIELTWQVPAQYLLAILGVETSFGRITGKYRVIDALSTLAFDYPPRAEYFTNELEQYLLLTREEALDPLLGLGSYAGAMGPPQFMPRSVRLFAVDGDGDGRRDLWTNWADILASIANYLRAHGWKSGEPITVQLPPPDDPTLKPTGSHNFGVIMQYNRSPLYALAVHDLATELHGRVLRDDAPL